jgi:signal transduction histidine kinase
MPTIPAAVTPAELAELMSAFTSVTTRLERTHEDLRLEVARLQRELSEANEQLQRSKRLAALGEMAAGIAHEVRNPLGSIALYARMLESDLADRPEPRSTACKIASAVRGLDLIVGDVLSFSREMRVQVQEVEARDLFDRAIEAAWSASISGVRIVRDDLDRGVSLRCDPALVHQALVNIVRNALQAMSDCAAPPDGHALRVDAIPADGDALAGVAVIDTGPGVTPEVLDRMFNPFFTTRATGTGLGLAIVHRIVDAHGGRVGVRNVERGRGAIVELRLPAVDARREPATPEVEIASLRTKSSGRRRGSRPESTREQEASR